jgi:hypothetical protein
MTIDRVWQTLVLVLLSVIALALADIRESLRAIKGGGK